MKNSIYKVIVHEEFGETIQRTDADGAVWSIPADLANSDYQEYLASLEATEPEEE